jgi:hypothetical protein
LDREERGGTREFVSVLPDLDFDAFLLEGGTIVEVAVAAAEEEEGRGREGVVVAESMGRLLPLPDNEDCGVK